ncbi:FAD-dependent oxidoreductase [Halopseudomonas bauzanensis]|uniref:FAD-dependent oxidoreductase n=2 Tax=Halopseudomonas bauzanensis TaxID=653930 RepID=A0A4U0YKA0_9GAMM|nr:FAD-dependent oxidoreductase [Halopseudomonas bauzanensis]
MAASKRQWDMEADILCVGSGAAACAAAVTATHLGDQVILLEKSPIFGGTTRRSGGVAWIPNNFTLKQHGQADDETKCLQYMARYAYAERYQSDSPTLGLEPREFALLQAFYRNAAKAVDTFQELEASHFIRFELPGGVGPSADYAPSLPENHLPKGRSIWPDPAINGGRGSAIVDGMIAWVQENGGKALADHPVVELIQEEGRVIGVVAEHQGQRLNIRARKGVIFGTGGFAHNPELTRRYQRALCGSCAAPGSTGDFIGMATQVGAALGRMDSAWRSQVVLESALQNSVVGAAINIPPADSMVLVNKLGQRVVNEKRNYNDRTRIHQVWDSVSVDYPNQLLFMVFDQRAMDVFGGNYPIPGDIREVNYVISGANLAELQTNVQQRLNSLADKIAVSPLASDFADRLGQTMERYNEFARNGEDKDFKRGGHPAEIEWQAYFSRPRAGMEDQVGDMPNATMHPFADQGPYYAIIVAPGALDTNTGPLTDEHAQVMDNQGQPIPGLYGAGNCIASPTGEAYMGAGGTIGPALTFGYIAATSAHKG